MERLSRAALVAALLLVAAVPADGGRAAVVAPPVRALASHLAATGVLAGAGFVPSPVVSLVGVESFSGGPAAGGGTVTLGSGFVVAADGQGAWVATASHVVTGAAAAVYLAGDRTPHLADRLARSAAADLALLHVPGLHGVSPVELAPPAPSAWAAEIACVRWPGWSYQSYPLALGPGAFATLAGIGPVLLTPTLEALPGCSGGPIILYRAGSTGATVVAGVVVEAVAQPTAVGYVPAADVAALLAGVTGAGPGR
jgi:hypothetical protein